MLPSKVITLKHTLMAEVPVYPNLHQHLMTIIHTYKELNMPVVTIYTYICVFPEGSNETVLLN